MFRRKGQNLKDRSEIMLLEIWKKSAGWSSSEQSSTRSENKCEISKEKKWFVDSEAPLTMLAKERTQTTGEVIGGGARDADALRSICFAIV